MTNEERAKISRDNGAKSQGPITESGKAASSQNADKAEAHAKMLSPVLDNEDRDAYDALVNQLTQIYRPLNQVTAAIVQDIATARWQIDRLDHCLTLKWNLAIAVSAVTAPELTESETMARAAQKLYTSGAVAHRINRQIDQLQLRIARFERRIKFVHANFPAVANQPAAPAEMETQINEPAVNGEQPVHRCKIFVMPPPAPPPTPSAPETARTPIPEKQHERTQA